jgi:hypothetical protein
VACFYLVCRLLFGRYKTFLEGEIQMYEKAIENIAGLAAVGITAGLTFKLLDKTMDWSGHATHKKKTKDEDYNPFAGMF